MAEPLPGPIALLRPFAVQPATNWQQVREDCIRACTLLPPMVQAADRSQECVSCWRVQADRSQEYVSDRRRSGTPEKFRSQMGEGFSCH